MYCVAIIIKTKPEHSVDGKYHETVNYYAGVLGNGSFAMVNFTADIEKAVKFDDITKAKKFAKKYDGEVKEVTS